MTSIPLRFAATIVAGQSPESDAVEPLDEGVPFLQGNAEFGPLYPSARWECDSAPKRAQAGDILISVRAPVGAVNIADHDYGIGRGLCAVRPSLGDRRYFYWWLLSSTELLNSVATGSTFTAISAGDLGDLRVPIGDVQTQKTIATFVDRETAEIDAFIADQEELIGLLAERRMSAQVSVLSSADTAPRVRLRFLFEQSREDNSIESEVLSVYREYGVIPKSSRTDNFNKTPDDVSRYLVVRPGFLVVNKMKAWQGSLGVSKFEGIVSPDYEVLQPTSDALSAEFAHLYLRSSLMIGEYVVRSVGIRPSQWRLYWEQLRDIEIPLPSLEVQHQIVWSLDRETAELDAAIADAREAIALSHERRAALIAAAVTGKIDVRGVG